MRLIANIFCIGLLFLGCDESTSPPEGILEEGAMIEVLTDVHLVEGAKTGRKIMGDTLRLETYYAKVFSKHGTDMDAFNASFKYYANHPETMDRIYERVIENLNRMEVNVPKWEELEEQKQDSSLAEASGSLDSNALDSITRVQKEFVQQLVPFKKDSTAKK